MKVVNWQKNLTHQQSDLWIAFQDLLGDRVLFVLNSSEHPSRKKLGWQPSDYSSLDYFFLHDAGWWRQATEIIALHKNAVHVFNGFWGDRRFFLIILYSVWQGLKVCVMQEAYSTQSVGYFSEESEWTSALKVNLRPFLYRMACWILNHINRHNQPCILAISTQGVHQMLRAGFSTRQVFPFGYFLKRSSVKQGLRVHKDSLRVIFIGSLLKRKGVDSLVEAVLLTARFGIKIKLDVYGYGDPLQYFPPAASGIVNYKGVIPADQSQAVIAQYDVLVLPSRHDGWGVVVNEALLQGVPVILSTNVGAKCLVEATNAGAVFKTGNIPSLSNLLMRLIQEPGLLTTWKENAKNAGDLILPQIAANYMMQVFTSYFYNDSIIIDVIWKEKKRL